MTSTSRAKSFDRVAAAYDAVRPGYPGGLYERIIEYGSLTPQSRVLEVGVGTGKATMPLAERGFEIFGIEPGADLSSIARANLARFPRVSIATTTFEAWTVEPGAFGLAFSAQAFHWLSPELRVRRFAEALHADGVLAVFGNAPQPPAGRLGDDLAAVYRMSAPSLSFRRAAERWYTTAASPLARELGESRLLQDAEFKSFEWQYALDAASYCRLLSTYSDHSALPESQLAGLLAKVSDVVQSHGGTLTLPYRTGLYLARRRAEA